MKEGAVAHGSSCRGLLRGILATLSVILLSKTSVAYWLPPGQGPSQMLDGTFQRSWHSQTLL